MSGNARMLGRDEIPVIDIGPLVDGSASARVAGELANAATHIGFIYVGNHGIDSALIENARNAALEFFRQPLEKKLELMGDFVDTLSRKFTPVTMGQHVERIKEGGSLRNYRPTFSTQAA